MGMISIASCLSRDSQLLSAIDTVALVGVVNLSPVSLLAM